MLSTQFLLRPMSAADLEMVLAWRNHPDVRRYMYTQHEITLDEHTRWFEKSAQEPSRSLLIFEKESVPLGFISIHQKNAGGIADWGFYVAPGAPRGTGQQLGDAVLRYAFRDMGIYKLCGQALNYNQRSINFHLRLGFIQEGILRKQHFDGEYYHDVVYFGLFASEWKNP